MGRYSEHSDSRTSLPILTLHTQNITERHNLLPHLAQTRLYTHLYPSTRIL
ncbi:hypothetical protein A2U01_0067562, partial [Trifolium medium]|nr:hypothetical protein [Trifolium medium]